MSAFTILSTSYIKRIVEENCNVSDISLKSREIPLPYLRSIYYTLCKEYVPKITLQKIAKGVNIKNHATVKKGLDNFDSFKSQVFFKPYLEVYFNCKDLINLELKKIGFFKFQGIDRLRTIYKENTITILEQYRFLKTDEDKIVNQSNRKNIIEKISNFDDDEFFIFEFLVDSILTYNK